MMSGPFTSLRAAALIALATLGTSGAAAQQGGGASTVARLAIRAEGELAAIAASGVITFPGQGHSLTLHVVATDAAGKPVPVARYAPKWTTTDKDVVSLYGNPSDNPVGTSMRIVAQQDGRATVSVTVLGKTASIPVAVGAARATIAASELDPRFRVARLELTTAKTGAGESEAELEGRALLLKENGHSLTLKAKAFAADGTPVSLDAFPVVWTTGDQNVAELWYVKDTEVTVVSRRGGRATVIGKVQDVTLPIEVFVGDARSEVDASLLSASPVATASGATSATATAAPTTATVTSTTVAIAPTTATATTSATTTTSTATTLKQPIASGTPITKGETVAASSAPAVVPPSSVTAIPAGDGYVVVHWSPVPDATGYYIFQQLPTGAWAGASLAGGNAGIADTIGTTFQLAPGSYRLAVVSVFDANGTTRSAPSAPVSVTVPRWIGRYRISLLGFKVDRETADDPLQTDGKHDEVFVRAAVAERTPDAQLVGGIVERQTLVYGDANAPDWQNASSPNRRIAAGSASTLGGLMTGDGVPSASPWQRTSSSNYDNRLPLLLWEGELQQGGNQVQIAASIWETDQRPGTGLMSFGSASPERAALDAAAAAARRLAVEQTGGVIMSVAAGVLAAPAVLPLLVIASPGIAGTAAAVYGAQATATALEPLLRPATPRLPLLLDASASLDALSASINASPLVSNPVNSALDQANQATLNAINSVISSVSKAVNLEVGSSFLNTVESLALTFNLKDRPLGLRKTGTVLAAQPWVLTFSLENIEGHALVGNGPANLGPGVYAMQFRDDPLTFTNVQGGNGVYTLYLQVQRIP